MIDFIVATRSGCSMAISWTIIPARGHADDVRSFDAQVVEQGNTVGCHGGQRYGDSARRRESRALTTCVGLGTGASSIVDRPTSRLS